MKTIVSSKNSETIDVSTILNATLEGTIVVLHQCDSMGILSHNFGCRLEDRRLFFTPLKFRRHDGHFWDGCSKTMDVKEFISIFVGPGSKILVFETHVEFASWLLKQKINEKIGNDEDYFS